ncbi:acetyl-CoA carboxylase biotin carboxyl carrier protein [Solitalea koreensis]|uniref:Biotin carboxyl carrier protein of acetyl-CoA carboxylase n=1 Tax=Solitalea koreensis TaxID=543615 RepID=A0A521AQV2_9SPHI|nr:acetyl-CoA carboxylase biotin carboxyl carrier protein [Solitalea koreensis]SMO37187.1 acetyl-CoA carboxylase biotin carboxyl carrier protein [Solitalea koreensis]
MEIKEIQELIKFVSKSGVNEVSIERKDFKITIKTTTQSAQTVVQANVPAMAPLAAAPVAPVVAAPAAPAPAPVAPAAENANHITIKSPMIGTFYRQPSPDKPLFVNVGDEIKPGQVICIIEAMKLFNEIESEISGRIVKVLVDNASPVEYDQPLFIVEKL